MKKTINAPPPSDYESFTPSELFRFFFQIGRWTEDSFSDELQAFTRGKLVSTVTINKWKNRNVIPTRYSGPFLNLIESKTEPGFANKWVNAFETVWARHAAGRTYDVPKPQGPTRSNTVRNLHCEWISRLFRNTSPGEVFSPADVYVPLQFIDPLEENARPQDAEDIINLLVQPENLPAGRDWVLITGTPGSGKSITAVYIAKRLSEEDVFPILIRGHHLSNIDIDIAEPDRPIGDSFSPRSFLKAFRTSSFEKACLVIDGLDQIYQPSLSAHEALSAFVSEIEAERAVCAAHGKCLQIVGFGRDLNLQLPKTQLLPETSQHFELLSLDGSLAERSGRLSFFQRRRFTLDLVG